LVGLAILALDLTHNPTTLGTVLAAQAIPRTLFMLLGGVVTDRFRPTGVLRVANLLMTFLVGALATLTALHVLALWHLYVYAVLAGGVYS
jgi:MFS family permease